MDSLPIWAFFFIAALSAAGFVEIGYFWSRRTAKVDSRDDAPVASMVGATLALLAFILAFSFQIASSRYDARRTLVVRDANAIGTCYLRAGYLEEPYKSNIRKILKEYIAVRLHVGTRLQTMQEALDKSITLQNQLWAETESLAKEHPNFPAYSLFIGSANDVIDIHGERVAAVLDARVPHSVWLATLIIAALAMIGTGYFCGMNGRRHSPEALLMVLAFSVVVVIVIDLDRPWEGTIATPQTPMINLAKQLGVE